MSKLQEEYLAHYGVPGMKWDESKRKSPRIANSMMARAQLNSKYNTAMAQREAEAKRRQEANDRNVKRMKEAKAQMNARGNARAEKADRKAAGIGNTSVRLKNRHGGEYEANSEGFAEAKAATGSKRKTLSGILDDALTLIGKRNRAADKAGIERAKEYSVDRDEEKAAREVARRYDKVEARKDKLRKKLKNALR